MPSLRPDYAIIVLSCLPHVRFKEAEKRPDLMETYKFHNFIGARSSSCQQEPNVDYLPTFLADRTKFVRVYRLGCFLPCCRSTGRRSSFHGRKKEKKKASRGDDRRLVQVSALNTTILFCKCGGKLGQVTCPNPWSPPGDPGLQLDHRATKADHTSRFGQSPACRYKPYGISEVSIAMVSLGAMLEITSFVQ